MFNICLHNWGNIFCEFALFSWKSAIKCDFITDFHKPYKVPQKRDDFPQMWNIVYFYLKIMIFSPSHELKLNVGIYLSLQIQKKINRSNKFDTLSVFLWLKWKFEHLSKYYWLLWNSCLISKSHKCSCLNFFSLYSILVNDRKK